MDFGWSSGKWSTFPNSLGKEFTYFPEFGKVDHLPKNRGGVAVNGTGAPELCQQFSHGHLSPNSGASGPGGVI